MLIALYHIIIANLALPKVGTISDIASIIGYCVIGYILLGIFFSGIDIVLSLIKIRIPIPEFKFGPLIGAIVNGVFIFFFQKVVEGIGWIVRKTVDATPKVYTNSKNFYTRIGANEIVSTGMAIVTVLFFIAIII